MSQTTAFTQCHIVCACVLFLTGSPSVCGAVLIPEEFNGHSKDTHSQRDREREREKERKRKREREREREREGEKGATQTVTELRIASSHVLVWRWIQRGGPFPTTGRLDVSLHCGQT